MFSQFSFANSFSHSVASEFLKFLSSVSFTLWLGFFFYCVSIIDSLNSRGIDPHSHFTFFNWIVFISNSTKNAYYSAWTIANKQINLLIFLFGIPCRKSNGCRQCFNRTIFVLLLSNIKHFSLHSKFSNERTKSTANKVCFYCNTKLRGNFFSLPISNEWTNPEVNN